MIIVGGTYHEVCRDPGNYEVFGSGVRAAYALSNVTHPPRLHSVAYESDANLTKARGIELDVVERSQPIRFMYDTPISRPVHDFRDPGTRTVDLVAEADAMLVFGMVEAHPDGKGGPSGD